MASFISARNWPGLVRSKIVHSGCNGDPDQRGPARLISIQMRAVLLAVAALACVSGAESALRGGAADGWTRAVTNVYRATQAGSGPLLGEVTMQDTNRGCVSGRRAARWPPRWPCPGPRRRARPLNSTRWRSLLLQPSLVGLPPGRYGFFVHKNGA